MSKTLVIDCNNLCYGSFYTFGELSHEEKKTGVIFGFLLQLLSLAEKFDTNKFIFCWDSKKNYRKIIYPEYKANRRKNLTDEEQRDLKLAFGQFTLLRTQILPELGFSNIFHQTGYEADDLIAKVVKSYTNDFVVVSTDKDLYQLLDRCNIYNHKTKKVITEEVFKKKHGVEVHQWVDVKCFMGDSGDNIKGIEGVGEVKAIQHINSMLGEGKIYDRVASKEGQEIIARNVRLIYLPFQGATKKIRIDKGRDKLIRDKFISTFVDYGFQSFTNKKMLKRWEIFYG